MQSLAFCFADFFTKLAAQIKTDSEEELSHFIEQTTFSEYYVVYYINQQIRLRSTIHCTVLGMGSWCSPHQKLTLVLHILLSQSELNRVSRREEKVISQVILLVVVECYQLILAAIRHSRCFSVSFYWQWFICCEESLPVVSNTLKWLINCFIVINNNVNNSNY